MFKTQKVIAGVVKKVAEVALTRDANSTTCTAIYQPKVPAKLDNFKKTNKNDK